MRKSLAVVAFILFSFQSLPGYGWNYNSGYQSDNPDADQISTSTTNFNGNLSAADTNLQSALDTLDNAASGGAGALDDLSDVTLGGSPYTAGKVLRADGTGYVDAVLAHADLSGIGTNAHSVIDTHIDSATTVHASATNLIHTTGTESMSGVKTFSSAYPVGPGLTPTTATQLVDKSYVDTLFSTGARFVAAVNAATTTTLAANTYNNGTAGVGATLTGNANGAFATIDGVAAALNNTYLVKNEAAGANNGGYKLTTVGDGSNPYVLTRMTEYDTSAEVVGGTFFNILAGTTNGNTQWALTTTGTVTMGTTTLTFSQLSAPITYTASLGVKKVSNDFQADLSGTGAITLTGNSMQVAVDDSSIERSANALQVKALGVTNAMLAGSIADSKLSQITTASKVSGAALTSLTSVPSGASTLPTANLGSGTANSTTFLRGDQTWATPSGLGSGVATIGYTKALDTSVTTTTVSNTATETTIYSYSVPGGTFSTNKAIRVGVDGTYTNNSAANRTITVRAKYGSTTLCTKTTGSIGTSASTGHFYIEFIIASQGATNSQEGYMYGSFESGANTSVNIDDRGSAAEDSTGALNLVITVQHSAANANLSLVKKFATSELINASDTIGAPVDATYVTLTSNSSLTAERVLKPTRCIYLADIVAADDNFSMGGFLEAVTITDVWCESYGTLTTKPNIALQDGAGNAMTHTTPTCSSNGATPTSQSVTSGGGLTAKEVLMFDVTNTPSPTTDDCVICVAYTID